MKILVFILSLSFFLVSCTLKPELLNEFEYLNFISSESNGLTKQKSIYGYKIIVQHIPNDYLIYKELDGATCSNSVLDSLRNAYGNSLTFRMNIGPDKEKSNSDITYRDVPNFEKFKERILKLSFNMKDYVALKTDSATYIPVLAHFERIYALKPDREFTFVFIPTENTYHNFFNSSKYDFVLDDEIFNIGINHFVFLGENIINQPRLKFITHE